MDAEYAVYDTVYLRFVGGVSTDQEALQTDADALTASTGRAHTVVQVQAADTSGGGVILDGPQYQCEMTEGQIIPPASGYASLSWDSVDPALGEPGTALALSAGLYLADLELDFDAPDAAWVVALNTALPGEILTSPAVGPAPIAPGDDSASRRFLSQLTLRVMEDGTISFGIRPSCDPDAVDPTSLNVNYGLLVLTKIG